MIEIHEIATLIVLGGIIVWGYSQLKGKAPKAILNPSDISKVKES